MCNGLLHINENKTRHECPFCKRGNPRGHSVYEKVLSFFSNQRNRNLNPNGITHPSECLK